MDTVLEEQTVWSGKFKDDSSAPHGYSREFVQRMVPVDK